MNNVALVLNEDIKELYKSEIGLVNSSVIEGNSDFVNIWELELPIYSEKSWEKQKYVDPKYLPSYKCLKNPIRPTIINFTKPIDNFVFLPPLVSIIVSINKFDGTFNTEIKDITDNIVLDIESTLEENDELTIEELNDCLELVNDIDGKYLRILKPCKIDLIIKVKSNEYSDFRYIEAKFKIKLIVNKSEYAGFAQLSNYDIPYIKTVNLFSLNIEDIVSNVPFKENKGNSFQTRSTGKFEIEKIVDIDDNDNYDNLNKIYYIHGTQKGDDFYQDLDNCIIPIKLTNESEI